MLTQEHIPAAYKNRLDHYQVKKRIYVRFYVDKERVFDYNAIQNSCSRQHLDHISEDTGVFGYGVQYGSRQIEDIKYHITQGRYEETSGCVQEEILPCDDFIHIDVSRYADSFH